MPAPRNKTKRESINLPMPRHEHCWAKTTKDAQGREVPGINVRDHCLNVGCVAEALIKLLPQQLRNLLPPGTATLASLHDIGKVSPGFQQKCPAWLGKYGLSVISAKENWALCETHHGKVTAFALRDYFRSRWCDDAWEHVAHCIGAHHGILFGKLFAKGPKKDPTNWAAPARRELIEELERVLGGLPKRPARVLDSALWYLAGLITVADWIGSDERFFSPEETAKPRTKAAAVADGRRALSEIGWQRCRLRVGLNFEDLFGFAKPTNLQVRVASLSQPPRVVLIEDSMGAGKTEAALALAYRLMDARAANGLYFAMPTQVTSNRIHLRVHAFLRRAVARPALLRLTHASSWLRDKSSIVVAPAGCDDKTYAVARQWFTSTKRALLALYGVGTIDQALLGVVAAKHFFVRQFALAGKVVILDEVHSYDLYTGTLVDHLVRELRQLGATVVILSATLTAERKRELLGLSKRTRLDNSYPLVSVAPKSSANVIQLRAESEEPKQVAVRCVELSEADAVAECLRRAGRAECVLWIRNTVAEAQAVFRHLRSERCGDEPMVALLHSRFPYFRREQLERLWLTRLGKNPRRRPRGCVLVATQVVEQSVDVDADFLLTDLAPTDMLLQRIGRLWRHQERPDMAARRPATALREVWVNRPNLAGTADAGTLKRALGKSAKVYAPYVLLRSLTEWLKVAERSVLELPRDIRPLLEATYAQPVPTEPKSWTVLRHELQERRAELKDHAEAVTRVWSMEQLNDEEGVQTRWSKFQTGWLLLVRNARTRGGDLELEPLRGRPFVVQARNWTIDAAKKIHRNLVRVDAWMIREAYGYMPDALREYASGQFALGILKGDRNGPIRWPGQEEPSRLYYHEDVGVEIQPKRKGTSGWQPSVDDDESYD